MLAGQAHRRRSLPPARQRAMHVLGRVDEADKPALYAAATSLVSVSLHEGFGFPPLEASACGTPSVVSDLPVFAVNARGGG
ncbi:MAG: glycosyltransferase [Hymenobacter sp.]